MKTNIFIETFGWYGTLAIVGAYFGNSFGYLDSQSIVYQLLNITGAVGIALESYVRCAYQSVVLQIVWILVGAIALSTIIF